MFSASKKVLLMGLAAVAVGIFSSSCIVLEDAEVKYNWDYYRQSRIIMVAASYQDVRDWYYDVYYPQEYGRYDGYTHAPRFDGNINAPNNMYSSSLSYNHRNQYYPVPSGNYTAVCTVRDYDGDIIDIVANYHISLGSDKRYYEVFFDVDAVLDRDYSYAWDLKNRSYPAKAPASSLIRTFEKDGVTYRVFRRPMEAGSE